MQQVQAQLALLARVLEAPHRRPQEQDLPLLGEPVQRVPVERVLQLLEPGKVLVPHQQQQARVQGQRPAWP